jgi:hypothetical protein
LTATCPHRPPGLYPALWLTWTSDRCLQYLAPAGRRQRQQRFAAPRAPVKPRPGWTGLRQRRLSVSALPVTAVGRPLPLPRCPCSSLFPCPQQIARVSELIVCDARGGTFWGIIARLPPAFLRPQRGSAAPTLDKMCNVNVDGERSFPAGDFERCSRLGNAPVTNERCRVSPPENCIACAAAVAVADSSSRRASAGTCVCGESFNADTGLVNLVAVAVLKRCAAAQKALFLPFKCIPGSAVICIFRKKSLVTFALPLTTERMRCCTVRPHRRPACRPPGRSGQSGMQGPP